MTQPTTDYALEAVPAKQAIQPSPAKPALNPAPKKNYALVTGASSGIGEAFARLLASKKKPLILVGRNEAKLKALAEELRTKEGIDVRFLGLDLARSKELPLLPGKLQKMGIVIDVLINNAGFGKSGLDVDISYEDDLNMVNLNCRALLAMTKLFLPGMLQRGKGAIINIASVAGFAPWPTMATYAATKAFVISYSETLAEELKGKGVKILCSCPGAVATNFQKSAGMKVNPEAYKKYNDPKYIAEKTLDALKSGKSLVIVGQDTSWTKMALNFLPRSLFNRFGS